MLHQISHFRYTSPRHVYSVSNRPPKQQHPDEAWRGQRLWCEVPNSTPKPPTRQHCQGLFRRVCCGGTAQMCRCQQYVGAAVGSTRCENTVRQTESPRMHECAHPHARAGPPGRRKAEAERRQGDPPPSIQLQHLEIPRLLIKPAKTLARQIFCRIPTQMPRSAVIFALWGFPSPSREFQSSHSAALPARATEDNNNKIQTLVQIAGRNMCPLTSDYFRGMALQSTYRIDINPYAMVGRRNTNGNLAVYQGESAFAMETGVSILEESLSQEQA